MGCKEILYLAFEIFITIFFLILFFTGLGVALIVGVSFFYEKNLNFSLFKVIKVLGRLLFFAFISATPIVIVILQKRWGFTRAISGYLAKLMLLVVLSLAMFQADFVPMILRLTEYGGHVAVTVEYEKSGGAPEVKSQKGFLVIRTKSSLLLKPYPFDAKSVEIPTEHVRRILNCPNDFLDD